LRRLKLRRPSHTTVVAYLCLFIVLGGGAYAAQKIGSGQLKKNAVTTSKIRNGAVTTKKIRNGAVNGAKVADGSITGADVNVSSLPVSRVTQRNMRGSSSVAVSLTPGTWSVYPLSNPTYTQVGDETDLYAGAVDVTFQPTCNTPRSATAVVAVDTATPTNPAAGDIVAAGIVNDAAGGSVSKRINLGPYQGSRFEPGSPTTQTVTLAVEGSCSGGSSGIDATSGAVDVIGNR
jgi:hypothetical protein